MPLPGAFTTKSRLDWKPPPAVLCMNGLHPLQWLIVNVRVQLFAVSLYGATVTHRWTRIKYNCLWFVNWCSENVHCVPIPNIMAPRGIYEV
jgi:hypothetical protein